MKRSGQRKQFLNDPLITAIEGGMTGQWGEIYAVVRDDDLNILSCKVTDSIDPIENQSQTWVVTIETMAKGLSLWRKSLRDEQGPSFWPSVSQDALLLADETSGDEGDYDACDADCILQLGLFGKTIFG